MPHTSKPDIALPAHANVRTGDGNTSRTTGYLGVGMRVLMVQVSCALDIVPPGSGQWTPFDTDCTVGQWTVDTVEHTPVQESGEKMQANARMYLADARNIGWTFF